MNTASGIVNHRSETISSSLLMGVRSFHADAWKRMVHIYGPLVFTWCINAGLGRQDAEDLGQEVFRAVALRIGQFERVKPSDTFGGWLRIITRHKIADFWRARSKAPPTTFTSDYLESIAQMDTEHDSPAMASEGAVASERCVILRRALALLRTEFRESSWKAFWETAVVGRATADVATDLNMSPMAVRKAKSRVLKRLRDEFEGLGDIS